MTYWNGSQWVPKTADPPRRPSRGRRFLGASLEASLIVLLVFGLIASTALAAKGGKGGGSGKDSGTFSLVLLDSTDGVARHGQRVTFDVSTSASAPMVGVRCYQGQTWVLDGYVGYFDGYLFDPWFTLDSGYWADDVAASCNARLFVFDKRGREKVMATMAFAVAP